MVVFVSDVGVQRTNDLVFVPSPLAVGKGPASFVPAPPHQLLTLRAATWERLLPPEIYYPLHLNLIRHGREICGALKPKCEICPLQRACDYYNRVGEWAV